MEQSLSQPSASDTMFRILRDLGLSDTNEVSNTELWLGWVYESMREMRLSITSCVREHIGRVEQCVAYKPFGYLSTVSLHILEASGACVSPRFRPVNDMSLAERGYWSEYDVESQPFIFVFSSNANGQDFRLAYNAIYLADDRTPVVDARYYTSILAYCRYKWCVRNRSNGERSFSQSDEIRFKQSWYAEYRRNKANATRDLLNPETISQLMGAYNDPLYLSDSPEGIRRRITTLRHLTAGQPGLGRSSYYLGTY